MTDRIKGLTVTLDEDYRVDDAEAIVNAIRQIRGVAHVALQCYLAPVNCQGSSRANINFQEGTHMATYDRVWRKATKEPTTKAEFYQIAGITPELVEFVDEFIKRPEMLKSLPLETQHQIEDQMDAVLALFT